MTGDGGPGTGDRGAVRHFWKVQGAGNDFVLYDCLREPELDWTTLAPRVCDRHTGIGSDGLLIVLPSAQADFRMRMFNPDGTEDYCGNGIRCVARYLHDQGLHRGEELCLETSHGSRLIRFIPGADGPPEIEVDMGAPDWSAAAIPAVGPVDPMVDVPLTVAGRDLRITSLSTGTAHTVLFCEELPDDTPFLEVSPALETHPWFPERTSVLWCCVEAHGRLRLRIWERGVGETLACGSGVCAAAAAALRHGRAGDHAEVICPGGTFQVRWEGDHEWLRGPAEVVFEGVIKP